MDVSARQHQGFFKRRPSASGQKDLQLLPIEPNEDKTQGDGKVEIGLFLWVLQQVKIGVSQNQKIERDELKWKLPRVAGKVRSDDKGERIGFVKESSFGNLKLCITL